MSMHEVFGGNTVDQTDANWKTRLLILWGSHVAALGVYVLLALEVSPRPAPAEAIALLKQIGGLGSLGVPLLALAAGLALYRSQRPKLPDASMPVPADLSALKAGRARLLRAGVLMISLFELPAIAGVILHFLGIPLALFLRFIVVSLALQLLALRLLLSDAARLEG